MYGDIAIYDVSPQEARGFSKKVAELLGVSYNDYPDLVTKFKDGETDIKIKDSVRGKDVFVFQSYIPPIGERLYELELFLDAAKAGGAANRVTVVMPYCLGQRGERRTRARQPVPVLTIARNLKTNGADKILTVGIHAAAVGSIFNACGLGFEYLEDEYLVANYIIQRKLHDSTIATPDVGAAKRARKIKEIVIQNSPPEFTVHIAIADKYRPQPDKAEITEAVGNVKDRPVFIVDDIASTLNSIASAVEAYKNKGAREAYIIITHPVLVEGHEKALKKLCDDGFVKEIVFGNTKPVSGLAAENRKIKYLPFEPFVAEAIRRINKDVSISGLHKYSQIISVYQNARQSKITLD